MTKIHKKLGFVLIGFVAIVGIIVFFSKSGLSLGNTEDGDYAAVYMTSGDIYFGKLERFPRMALANAYTLQRTDNKNTPFNLVRFGDAFWGPKSTIELSEQNVLWVAELSENSPVLKSIKEQEVATQ